jgi:hypothetical protein
MSGSQMKDATAFHASARRPYNIPGLRWGCSVAEARAGLEADSVTDVGDCTAEGVLPFESEQTGFGVYGEAHFSCGALVHVRVRMVREYDNATPAAVFFGEMAAIFRRIYGPWETSTPPERGDLIVRQWPSDERGSLRMTLDTHTDEIVIVYYSGAAT